MRRHDRAYWKTQAGKLLKSQKGRLKVNTEKRQDESVSSPAVGGEDGIYMGVMTRDMRLITADPGTKAVMKQSGLNIDVPAMEQIRFMRPVMYKSLRDSAIATMATGEPVLSFLTEYTPLPEVHLLKMTPIDDDRIMWIAINVMKLASVAVTHWGPEVEEFLVENSFSMKTASV